MESKRECRHPRRTNRRMRALEMAEKRTRFWDHVIAGHTLTGIPQDFIRLLPSFSDNEAIMRFAARKRDIAITEVGNLRRKLGFDLLGAV